MKLKSIKTAEIPNGLVKVAGSGVGLMLPKVVGDLTAGVKPSVALTEQQMKTKLYVNGGFMLLGTLGALMIDGKDLLSDFVKHVSVASAGAGTLGVVKHFVQPSVDKMADGTFKTVLSSGLGCACNTPIALNKALGMPLRMPLRMPVEFTQGAGIERTEDVGYNPLG